MKARSAELHYWIRSDRSGRGYTTEAGERILRWGADELGLESFTLWAGVENRASRRVAEKLGFRDTGPMPDLMLVVSARFVRRVMNDPRRPRPDVD